MASRAKAQALAANDVGVAVVGEILAIPVGQIDATERMRPIDEQWATALGEMMKADGQGTAIEVCRLPGNSRYTLVAGGHRHRAFEIFPELGPIRAVVVDAERLKRKIAEIRENLHRKDLEPIDRATFISELVIAKKIQLGVDPAKDGRSASAAARWQDQIASEAEDANATIAFAYGWAAEIGEQIGLSKRSIEYDLMLVRRIKPRAVEALRAKRHPVLSNRSQLLTLAKSEPAEQEALVEIMCGDEPQTLADAVKARDAGKGKTVASPEDKRFSTFIGTFSRMGLAEKKGALAELARMLPAGFRIEEGPAKPAEASFPAAHEQYREEALETIEATLLLVDGLIEDEVFNDERADELYRCSGKLRMARMSIAGNGFELVANEPPPATAPELQPAVAIRASVKPDYLVCLECGERHKMLKRHLSSVHSLTTDAYLQRWSLPLDYPFVAPNYAEERRQLAKKIGLRGGDA